MTEQASELFSFRIRNTELDALKLVAGTVGVPVAEVIREAVHTKVESFKTDPEMRAVVAEHIGKMYELIGEVSPAANTGSLPIPDESLSR